MAGTDARVEFGDEGVVPVPREVADPRVTTAVRVLAHEAPGRRLVHGDGLRREADGEVAIVAAERRRAAVRHPPGLPGARDVAPDLAHCGFGSRLVVDVTVRRSLDRVGEVTGVLGGLRFAGREDLVRHVAGGRVDQHDVACPRHGGQRLRHRRGPTGTGRTGGARHTDGDEHGNGGNASSEPSACAPCREGVVHQTFSLIGARCTACLRRLNGTEPP